MSELRFNGVTIDHPGQRERERGEKSKVRLQLFTSSGRPRNVPLSEDELVRMLADAAKVLAILRGVRRHA